MTEAQQPTKKRTTVQTTGRKEWRWRSDTDRVVTNKRGWRRKLVREQYLFIEFSCGHWERFDLVTSKSKRTGRHFCKQCEFGESQARFDCREAA